MRRDPRAALLFGSLLDELGLLSKLIAPVLARSLDAPGERRPRRSRALDVERQPAQAEENDHHPHQKHERAIR